MPSRRLLRLISLALALLTTLDTAAWWWLSGRVVALYAAWQASQIAAGHAVTTGPVSRAGWPFWPGALVPDVVMATSAERPSGVTWRAASLRLTYVPWRPNVFTAEPMGAQSLQGGDAPAIPIIAARLAAAVPLDPAQPGGVVVDGRAIAALLRPGSLAAERLSLRLQPGDGDIAVARLSVPPSLAGGPLPFDGVIDALSLHAHATVALPETGSLATSLAAWRRAGGELRLSDIALQWGPLQASGAATVTLDAGSQPQATGAIRMTGYQDMVDALLRSGAITRSDASVASAMLGLLSSGEPGKPREVTLPFRLQDGIVSAGSVPLLRVPKFMPP